MCLHIQSLSKGDMAEALIPILVNMIYSDTCIP